MDKAQLQAAYVLHTRRFRDSSLLLDLFSQTDGRVVCVARGALKTKGGGNIAQPFQPLLVGYQGRGDVFTLNHLEGAGRRFALSGDRLFCGLYLNELVLRLTARQDPLPGLFEDYVATLDDLAVGAGLEPALRRFEVDLLGHIGVAMTLDQDDKGQPIETDRRYLYDIDHGPVRTSSQSSDSVHGQTLTALRSGEFPDKTTQIEARMLMRRVLSYHLDGQPLRSRELFR